MNTMPAIDLMGGRVVRLRQGDFARSRAFDCSPTALARRYRDAGSPWLHVVDLDGARAGAPAQLRLFAEIVEAGPRVQAGGGVRTREDVERLLAIGVARVVVGSLAVREPRTFMRWLAEFGAEHFCLALDLRRAGDGHWRIAMDAWESTSATSPHDLLERLAASGLRHVLTTDIARDGTGAGPDLSLYRELASRWPSHAWIASGGIRDAHDLIALRATGVAGCVVGTALLDGSVPLEEVAACWRAA
jgi:phosphoribosylformimino-5-aminoimidazole carboxamide ribotide isomerase